MSNGERRDEGLVEMVPVPDNWFDPSPSYAGWGSARFDSPPSVLEGPVTSAIGDTGRLTITMQVEKSECEADTLEALFGRRQTAEDGTQYVGIGGAENKCIDLSVRTAEGELRGNEIHIPRKKLAIGGLAANGMEVTFLLSQAVFTPVGRGDAKYWVLPLGNFISGMTQRQEVLDRHPLRVYKTPIVPDSLTGRDRDIACFRANLKNSLVAFLFNDAPAFIECLPNYDGIVSDLQQGRRRAGITCVAVGETGGESIGLDTLGGWFPFDIVLLLAMSSECDVGFPWVEFRDCDGRLVQRIHARRYCPPYVKSRRIIDEVLTRGTGHLLAVGIQSGCLGDLHMRTAIRCLMRAGRLVTSLQEMWLHGCLGLETLCKGVSVSLLDGLCDKDRIAVETALGGAATAILKAAQRAEKRRSHDSIRRIGARLKEVTTVSKGFGKTVEELAGECGLEDKAIIDRYLSRNPIATKKSWSALLQYGRGVAVHEGVFSPGEAGADKEARLLRFGIHIHDLLARIVLKRLGYDGDYQPSTVSWAAPYPLDWVKKNTPAADLGLTGD